MIKQIKTNKKKGFTLIELIVVMAVLAILVLLAAPKFLGHTKEAQFTKHINNAKVLEDASERYYIDHGQWPVGADADKHTPAEVSAYADKIYDITGTEMALAEGDYWDIDYSALSSYAKLPDEDERANYVLRSPDGKVCYLDGLTEAGVDRLPIPGDSNGEAPVEPGDSNGEAPVEPGDSNDEAPVKPGDSNDEAPVKPGDSNDETPVKPGDSNDETPVKPGDSNDEAPVKPGDSNDEAPVKPNEPAIPDYYVQATDADFTKDTQGNWRYMGSDDYVILPHEINGVPVTSYRHMFQSRTVYGVTSSTVKGVVSTNPNVTDMRYMFTGNKGTTLDLSNFDTANVTDMSYMFFESAATTLDLSSFNTANVTDMAGMFWNGQATSLDLSSFNTENVTDMSLMFSSTKATTLDLSSFNTANVTNMKSMFNYSKAPTLDLSHFNTAKVTDMSWMFSGSQVTTLDLSSFNTANVTDMRSMFQGSQATTLDLRSFDLRNIETGTTYNTSKNWEMFKDAAARTGYAYTTADRDKMNHSGTSRPSGLTFIYRPWY